LINITRHPNLCSLHQLKASAQLQSIKDQPKQQNTSQAHAQQKKAQQQPQDIAQPTPKKVAAVLNQEKVTFLEHNCIL
jgi:hypothetical protein